MQQFAGRQLSRCPWSEPPHEGCNLCRELELELHPYIQRYDNLCPAALLSTWSQPNDTQQLHKGRDTLLHADASVQTAVQLCSCRTHLVAAVLLADAEEASGDPQHEAQPNHD